MATNYSYSELMKMQEDAIKRVKEMQKRSTIATQNANDSFKPQASDINVQNISAKSNSQTPEVTLSKQETTSKSVQGQNHTQQHQNGNYKKSPSTNRNNFNPIARMLGVNGNRRPINARAVSRNTSGYEQEPNVKNANAPIQKPKQVNHNHPQNQKPPSSNIFNILGGNSGISSLFKNNSLTSLFGDNIGGFLGKGEQSISSILEKINDPENGDQLILLGLLVLLSKEDTDRLLLLALLYIFLG